MVQIEASHAVSKLGNANTNLRFSKNYQIENLGTSLTNLRVPKKAPFLGLFFKTLRSK